MVATAQEFVMEGKLTLDNVLPLLVHEGYLSKDNQRLLKVIGDTEERRKQHALEFIAERNWNNERKSGTKLDLPILVDWLVEKSQLPLFTIDPL